MLRHVILYFVKRSRSESAAMFPLPQARKSIKMSDCECDQWA